MKLYFLRSILLLVGQRVLRRNLPFPSLPHSETMQVHGKVIVLLALLRRPAGAVLPVCSPFDCLFECCDLQSPPLQPPACVADGLDGCANDPNSVTLGVSFTTSEEICVTGVKFYHEAAGTFATTLWNKTTESKLWNSSTTGSGWLSATLPTPYLMLPGQNLVAAYTAPSGAYSYQYDYFNSSITVGPVTFPGPDINGMYKYGHGSQYPGESPFKNSSYFVTPVWKPKGSLSYYVWNATSDTELFEIYDGFSGCISGEKYNIEARANCVKPTSVAFKVFNVSSNKVVKRSTETVGPFFVWGDNATSSDVFPSRTQLADGVFKLYTTVGTYTEIITFAQACTSIVLPIDPIYPP